MRWTDRIGRRIKLSDLHILLAVAQSGSMAKAASVLAVSHPVVSRSISELEHTLGVRLLERNPHGVELTEFGRAMLNRSHAAFDEELKSAALSGGHGGPIAPSCLSAARCRCRLWQP